MANDEIDPKLARRFAWGATPDLDSTTEEQALDPTSGVPSAPPAAEVEGGGEDEGEGEQSSDVPSEDPAVTARRFVTALAERVDEAWMLPPKAQGRALPELLASAAEQPIYLVAMDARPAARLGRLAVRHRASLTAAARRAFFEIAIWLPLEGSDGAEYLLEVARAGDPTFRAGLAIRDLADELEVPDDFAGRLAAIIEDASLSWQARTIALAWVDLPRPAARAPGSPLARALVAATRAPHLVARWLALEALQRAFPDVLTADDVVWMLNDAVEHPLPLWPSDEELERATYYYPAELARAVVAHPHPASEALLVRLATGECPGDYRDYATLNAAWALEVLARTHPDSARPIITRFLHAEWPAERAWGVAGAAALGPEAARPYLELAAADGSPDVAEAAREAWRELYDSPFPGDETAALPAALLVAPPSERLRGWLFALRGPPEARLRIARVALDAAPDPEALAALTVALADAWLFGSKRDVDLPEGLAEWAHALLERFGAPAVDALALLATRYGDGRYGWLRGIEGLLAPAAAVVVVVVNQAARERFAEIAARYFAAGGEADFAALGVLERAGVRRPEVEARLLERALDPADSRCHSASSALRAIVPAGAYRDELLARLEAELGRGDVARAGEAASLAASSDDETLLAAAERAVLRFAAWPWPSRAQLVSGFAAAAEALDERGRLAKTWRHDALVALDRAGFLVACVTGRKHRPRRRELSLLEAALESAHPRAAAHAAATLERWGALSPRSQAFSRALLGAPPVDQMELLNVGIGSRGGQMRAAWWPVLEALATSTDPEVAAAVDDQPPAFLPWKRERARLLAMLPRITVPAMRSAFEIHLRLGDDELYWQHPKSASTRRRRRF